MKARMGKAVGGHPRALDALPFARGPVRAGRWRPECVAPGHLLGGPILLLERTAGRLSQLKRGARTVKRTRVARAARATRASMADSRRWTWTRRCAGREPRGGALLVEQLRGPPRRSSTRDSDPSRAARRPARSTHAHGRRRAGADGRLAEAPATSASSRRRRSSVTWRSHSHNPGYMALRSFARVPPAEGN